MSSFNVHTWETAPAKSQEFLADAEKSFGFIPNLFGVFAESPAVLKSYLQLGRLFDETTFSATERQVVILAIGRYNECHYCVAAHSVIAGMEKVPADVIEAIRTDQPITNARLEALRTFVTDVVMKRGWVTEAQVAAFLDAGFTQAQVLEVILGISFKTLSNYVNHIASTPLDPAFASQAWRPGQKSAATLG